MDREKFEQLFNSVKNKSLSAQYLSETDSDENKTLTEAIKSADSKVVGEGASKQCSYFGDKQQFAMLKYKKAVVKKAQGQFRKTDIIKFNDWLISKGIKTPKLYTMFFADEHYHEIYERVEGNDIYLAGHNRIFKKAMGYDPIRKRMEEASLSEINDLEKTKSMFNLTKEEQSIIGDFLYDYTIKNQQLMLSYPDSEYENLLSQYRFLHNIGFRALDTNPGNLMVTKNGFKVIDLDIDKNLERILSELNETEGKKYTITQLIKRLDSDPHVTMPRYDNGGIRSFRDSLAVDYLDPFLAGSWHCNLMTEKQAQDVRNNVGLILEKAVNAMSKAGILLQNSWQTCDYLIMEAIDDNRVLYDRIMRSQIELKKKKALRDDMGLIK